MTGGAMPEQKKEQVKITLKHPVQFDGREVKELTMRRSKVKDQLAVEKEKISEAEREVRLFARLCNVPMELIEEIDLADYKQIQKEYGDFLS
jgi:hypothetical protein